MEFKKFTIQKFLKFESSNFRFRPLKFSYYEVHARKFNVFKSSCTLEILILHNLKLQPFVFGSLKHVLNSEIS